MNSPVKTPPPFEMSILTNGQEVRITAEMIKETLSKLADQTAPTKQQNSALHVA